MTVRSTCSAIAAGLLTCGMVALAPARAAAQAPADLPHKGGPMTMVGCLQQREHDKFLLASPTVGAATSVPEAACSATADEHAIKLEQIKEHSADASMLGHWVEVSGDLEKVQGKNRMRELNVASMRLVPIAEVRTAEAAPAPPAAVEPAPAPAQVASAPQAEQPVGTSGETAQLPKTAGELPLIGLIGLLSLAGGAALSLFGRAGVTQPE